MDSHSDAACDSVLSSMSSWSLTHTDAADAKCACCSVTKPSDVGKRQLTVSLSQDESDADTQSQSSSNSSVTDEEAQTEDKTNAVALMMEQSPIDIRESESAVVPMAEAAAVSISLCPTEVELAFNGTNFHVNWTAPDSNTLTIAGKVYHAVQFHFHTPSEHTFDGQHEAMEFHLVHKADDGSLAVVAVFFREGEENAFLAQFWDELPSLQQGVSTKVPLGVIDPRKLDILSGDYFRYRGSLTTPPYSEGVEWIVIPDTAEASREQLDAFRDMLPGPNARPVQALNKRPVSLIQ